MRLKTSSAPPRVFLGLRETAGYFVALREGFRQLNIPVTQVDLSADPFQYGQSPGRFQRLCRRVAVKRASKTGPVGAFWFVVQGCLAAWALGSAIPRHDAFIFTAHNRVFMRVAYPLLRLARKRVITVFLGSDVRPPYLNAKFVGLVGPIDARSLIQETDLARGRLLSAERWSHHVVNHPPTALFATRKFVDFMTLGLPYRASPRGAGPHEVVPGDRVRVLHAPSAPIVKGTAVIRSAIDELRSEGIPIDYQEISGRPHAEVLEELQLAQLVVAEAYSDQPMPGIATEAAAYGVAVIIGSEDWKGANHGLPPAAIPPTVQVHPTDIAQAIRELVLDPDRRARLGREGEAFVRARWSPAAVAGRFLRVIQDDIPEDWFRGPADVGYVHGVGLPQTRLAEAVATLVGSFGPGALGLDANPALRDRLLDLARTASGTETPAA